MLSASDADLASRDAALPALAVLLDTDAFADVLRQRLGLDGVGRAELRYIRYKPGTSCLVAYRLDAGGTALVDLHATAHRPDAPEKLAKAGQRGAVPGPLGPGYVVLDDLALAIAFFPNDARLTALPRPFDPRRRKNLLVALGWPRADAKAAQVRTLGYKPERRYVGALCVGGAPRGVLRVYTLPGYAAASRASDAFRSSGPLRIARRLGQADDHRVLLMEWLEGEPLDALLGGDAAAEPSARTGAALAALHAQDAPDLPAPSTAAQRGALLELAEWLAFVCPPLAGRARATAARLTRRLTASPGAPRPIHGDFYAKQVLVGDEAIALLDPDEAGWGEPAADLGNFLAHLEREVLRRRLPADHAPSAAAALLDGYRRCTAVDDGRVAVHAAAGLYRLAPHFFRDHVVDWPDQTAALLDRVEALLPEPARRTRTPASAPPVDPTMPFLVDAVDPAAVQPLLRRLPRLDGARVQRARLLRHKPGRRALVEYELLVDGATVVLCGKVRAKGLDERTHRLNQALWRSGFGPGSPDDVSVPEPIGTVPELRMWLQRKVLGVPLGDLVAGPRGVCLVRRAAEAIHRLHRTGEPTDRRHAMADELAILSTRLAALTEERPDWRDRLFRVLRACQRVGAATPPPVPTGIHRDFYPDQLLVDGERLWLLDLDLYCLGDPGLDVGNFVAHLTEQAVRAPGSAEALADCEAAMVERFVELAGSRVRPAIQAYAALTLARHIHISAQFPDRRPYTEAILELCEQRLAALEAETA